MPDVVIQRILRHSHLSTTTACYIKPLSDDVRDAMAKLENGIAALDSDWTSDTASIKPN